MLTAKIAQVLKLCLPTPVIEVILSNKIEYIRLKRGWMVKKLVIKSELKTCVPFLSVLYYNIESTKNKKLKLRCFIVILLTFCFSYIFIY